MCLSEKNVHRRGNEHRSTNKILFSAFKPLCANRQHKLGGQSMWRKVRDLPNGSSRCPEHADNHRRRNILYTLCILLSHLILWWIFRYSFPFSSSTFDQNFLRVSPKSKHGKFDTSSIRDTRKYMYRSTNRGTIPLAGCGQPLRILYWTSRISSCSVGIVSKYQERNFQSPVSPSSTRVPFARFRARSLFIAK